LAATKQLPPKLTPLGRASAKPKPIPKKLFEILHPKSAVAFAVMRVSKATALPGGHGHVDTR